MNFEKAWHKNFSEYLTPGRSFQIFYSPPSSSRAFRGSLYLVVKSKVYVSGANWHRLVPHCLPQPALLRLGGSSCTRLFWAELLLLALAGLLPLCSPNLHRHGLTNFPPLPYPPGSPTRQTLLMAPSAGAHPGSSTPSTPLLKGQGPL